MPTIAEMDAHAAYMDAWLRKCCEDEIATITKQLETMEHPYVRQKLEKELAEHKHKLAKYVARMR